MRLPSDDDRNGFGRRISTTEALDRLMESARSAAVTTADDRNVNGGAS